MTPEAQLALLRRGAVHVQVESELIELLKRGKPLRVKAGFDPTRPDLHLGHVVLLSKMKQFQDLGHEVVFVVGDFTAQIGDPSGRNVTRKVPTREEIEAGAKTYAEQAFKVLDPKRTRVVYNTEWLGKMSFDDVIRLAGKYTVAQMMEREDFRARFASHVTISLHELLYPLAQAYDSVALDCDIELGGTDQLFNLLVGREIMRQSGLRPQCVMTTPILEGINARMENGELVGDKMSKSLDNYVGVSESPSEQYGKLMSISDELMWRYYELLSALPETEIAASKRAVAANELNPKLAKSALAMEIVARFHDAAAAEAAREAWEKQFSRKETPDDIPEKMVGSGAEGVWLPKALVEVGLLPSTSEGRRRIEQGAVEVDGNKIIDVQHALKPGARYVVKAGKRAWVAIVVSRES